MCILHFPCLINLKKIFLLKKFTYKRFAHTTQYCNMAYTCKYAVNNFISLFNSIAVIEHVRDGCTVRAFLLPDFYHVTIMITGIKVCWSLKLICAVQNFTVWCRVPPKIWSTPRQLTTEQLYMYVQCRYMMIVFYSNTFSITVPNDQTRGRQRNSRAICWRGNHHVQLFSANYFFIFVPRTLWWEFSVSVQLNIIP